MIRTIGFLSVLSALFFARPAHAALDLTLQIHGGPVMATRAETLAQRDARPSLRAGVALNGGARIGLNAFGLGLRLATGLSSRFFGADARVPEAMLYYRRDFILDEKLRPFALVGLGGAYLLESSGGDVLSAVIGVTGSAQGGLAIQVHQKIAVVAGAELWLLKSLGSANAGFFIPALFVGARY